MSPAVWAIICGQIAHLWAFLTIAVMGPKYFKEVLGNPLFTMSWMMTLPFVTLWLWGWFSSWILQHMIEREVMSLINMRRTSSFISKLAMFLL